MKSANRTPARSVQAGTFALALLALSGCGYVGEPLPPALNIPMPVSDLRAIQRGENAVVEFTIPELTTDGTLIRELESVDLRIGPAGEPPFHMETWEASTRAIPVERRTPGPVSVRASIKDFAGRQAVVAVRTVNRRGRVSDWSNFAFLEVVEPLPRPSGLKLQASAEGVVVSWSTGTERGRLGGRIFRRDTGAGQEEAALIGTADGSEFIDRSAQYGRRYEYTVQTYVPAGESEAESEPSEKAEIVPVDTFPPAVPAGLLALAGAGSIELTWEPNTETDFTGYRVYKAVEDGPWGQLPIFFETPSYSDRSVEPGKRYRYAVASVDRAGNESERSEPVEITSP